MITVFTYDRALLPVASTVASTALQASAAECINQSVMQVITNERLDFKDIYEIERGENGEIQGIFLNAAKINDIKYKVTEKVINDIVNMEKTVQIPVGNIFDGALFSGKGRKIKITFLSVGAVKNKIVNKTKDSGINQTQLSSYIVVSVDITARVGGKTVNTMTETEIMLCETVIVGRVPDSFTSIGVLDSETRKWLSSYKD